LNLASNGASISWEDIGMIATAWSGMAWRRLALVLIGVICALPSALAADGVVKRKNIDKLTAQELAAYEHAIQIMKDRSAANQYDKTGYLWQAWVHNCPAMWVPKDGKEDGREKLCDFWVNRQPSDLSKYVLMHPGMCEHGKDLFLPWHRAEFYYFEKILQATDPDGVITDSRGQKGPSTKDVGVPYWDWLRPPTGARYAKAFEKESSPLFHQNRLKDPVVPGSAYAFSSRYLVSYMVQLQDWPTFAGYEMATKGGYGSFEAATHNPMHSTYMAGDMGRPPTAALDPVFFSFHAFIDLLYEQWLQGHGKDQVTSQNFFLRGDQPESIANPPGYVSGAGERSMGQVKLYFDTKALGYEYEIGDDDKLASKDELTKVLGLDDPQDPPVFGRASRNLFTRLLENGDFQPSRRPSFVRTLDLKIPAQSALAPKQKFFATLDRDPHEADVSYQMDVYIHPKAAPFDAASRPFSGRYLAGTGVHWGTGATHQHDADANLMKLEVTAAVLDLVKSGHAGETWDMELAITVLPLLTSFGEPSMQADPRLP
jgi:hypothetical protein